MCVYMSIEPKEGTWSPRAGVRDGCELVLGTQLGSSKREYRLLAAKPSLQPTYLTFEDEISH